MYLLELNCFTKTNFSFFAPLYSNGGQPTAVERKRELLFLTEQCFANLYTLKYNIYFLILVLLLLFYFYSLIVSYSIFICCFLYFFIENLYLFVKTI